jgi:hypothetical protein
MKVAVQTPIIQKSWNHHPSIMYHSSPARIFPVSFRTRRARENQAELSSPRRVAGAASGQRERGSVAP